MSWQAELQGLEHNKNWDRAITFLQNIIAKDPNNLEAYLSMNYLLMNLLVEEDYGNRHDYYADLLKKYFDESYAKFHNKPKYLFYTAITGYMAEWYFGLELDDLKRMLQKSMLLEPKNILYQWALYGSLDIQSSKNIELAIPYAQAILEKNSPIKEELKNMALLGNYLLDIMNNWALVVISKK